MTRFLYVTPLATDHLALAKCQAPSAGCRVPSAECRVLHAKCRIPTQPLSCVLPYH